MKVNNIVGNPPYQKHNDGNANSGVSIYPDFIFKYEDVYTNHMSYVIPARWLFQYKFIHLKEYLENRITELVIYDMNDNPFSSHVEIRGGLCYFLCSTNEDIKHTNVTFRNSDRTAATDISKYEIFVDPIHHSVVDKVLSHKDSSVASLHHYSEFYYLSTNDDRFHSQKQSENDVLCHVSSLKNDIMYVDQNMLHDNYYRGQYWKLLIPCATSNFFGNMKIAAPNEVHTDSYIHLECESEKHAQNMRTYLNTSSLAKYLLRLRRYSHNVYQKQIEWVSIPPNDELNEIAESNDVDARVYDRYSITDEEQQIIEEYINKSISR